MQISQSYHSDQDTSTIKPGEKIKEENLLKPALHTKKITVSGECE